MHIAMMNCKNQVLKLNVFLAIFSNRVLNGLNFQTHCKTFFIMNMTVMCAISFIIAEFFYNVISFFLGVIFTIKHHINQLLFNK